MIEINLLPGGGRKKATSTRASIDYAALFSGIAAKFGNPILLGAAALAVISLGVTGWLYLSQSKAAKTADSRLEKGLADSTRYASVAAARLALESKRDTLLRQVNLIHSIDEDRYIWPHIMDEVSRALPAYTWVTLLQFTGAAAGTNPVVVTPKPPPPPPPDTTPGRRATIPKPKPMPTAIPKDEISFRVTGRTVDIQAITKFMRDLANSPFVSVVDLESATPGSDAGKEASQFSLSMKYRRPDSTSLRRLPLVITVR